MGCMEIIVLVYFHTAHKAEIHKSRQVRCLHHLLATHIDDTVHGMWASGCKSLCMQLLTLTILISDANSSSISTRYK